MDRRCSQSIKIITGEVQQDCRTSRIVQSSPLINLTTKDRHPLWTSKLSDQHRGQVQRLGRSVFSGPTPPNPSAKIWAAPRKQLVCSTSRLFPTSPDGHRRSFVLEEERSSVRGNEYEPDPWTRLAVSAHRGIWEAKVYVSWEFKRICSCASSRSTCALHFHLVVTHVAPWIGRAALCLRQIPFVCP